MNIYCANEALATSRFSNDPAHKYEFDNTYPRNHIATIHRLKINFLARLFGDGNLKIPWREDELK